MSIIGQAVILLFLVGNALACLFLLERLRRLEDDLRDLRGRWQQDHELFPAYASAIAELDAQVSRLVEAAEPELEAQRDEP